MPSAEVTAAVARAARAELARRRRLREQKAEAERDLLAFGRMFWHVLEPETPLIEGWVLEALADLLMAISDGYHRRVIINIPPGSGKSLWLNVFLPAWEWGPCNMPHLRYIAASYNEQLPERDNAKFSKLIQSPEYQALWGDRVKVVSDSKGLVENSKTGWKRTTSTHSGTTGHRGDRVLIDDANDPNNVESDAVRSSTVHWLREVMPDRLNSLARGVIVNLQQRTHEEDATGTLAKHWDDFTWMMIPMEYDPLRDTPIELRQDGDGPIVWRDPRGLSADGEELEGRFYDRSGVLRLRSGSALARADGELAWPERFTAEDIARLKRIKGPYAYAHQYQQEAVPRGGGIIRRDWWKLWPREAFPPLGTVVASLDTAIKEGEANDYNAFVSFGAFTAREETGDDAPKLVLTSAWQDRMSLAELIRRVAESCFAVKADYLVIEDKARGHDVAAEIMRQYDDASWQTVLIPANGRGAFSGDKEARLRAVSVMFSGDVRKVPSPGEPDRMMDLWTGGMIYEPGMDWSQEVVDQVCGFPTAAHDDYVDAVSMALSFIRRNGVVLPAREYRRAEEEAMKYRSPMTVPYAIARRR